ncbi:hypothetical protein JM16_007177 [Phytophthora kernoviae]|uniref:VHS domain-containing protein n=1 Tax=Phytophthora kernoviae TaxID=325452 RepID=A0A8T0LQD3_9STRA|nr:hypothetical protein JM16_007177 [Phytophthora kernoviae]
MQSQRRPAPESTYASQAARWKQGFKTPQQQTPHQSDLENALISELCSSVGSSSFPPREVLQKLVRYLHTLDHDYICELLDDKFESPLWQVKAKALSVLSALLGCQEAEFYKQYYSGRLDLLEDLRNARKDMLRKRADKVYLLLKDYVPPDDESPLEMMRRMQEEEAEEAETLTAAEPAEMHALMHTSPVVTSAQTPQDLMMAMNDSPRTVHTPHSVFDALPAPTLLQPNHTTEQEQKEEEGEPELSDPLHDAFEGLDANDGGQALDSFDAYKPSSDAVRGGYSRCENDDSPVPEQSKDPLREVILEIEVPPGPMGVMLDRTIPDMTVIERFVPLPMGGRGYLELHPAICPGCALISINSIYVENKGLVEVGPILGSLTNAPKLLRFKKLMDNGRTANPSTLMMPYVPPPLEEDEQSNADEQSTEGGDSQHQPESEDGAAQGFGSDDTYMVRLNGYSSGLSEIEAKLKEILHREHGGQPVMDRRNQLAQLHGTVEKIQTQGIDSVIFGSSRPSNYEEVKQLRSTLVRKADELARLIQSTASTDPPVYGVGDISDEEKHPASAFAFVGGDTNSTVNDPPLGISQLQGDSGFQFLNANANPQLATAHGGNVVVPPLAPAQPDNSYGFSFLRDNAQQQQPAAGQLTVSQAPTSPSSSFGVLSSDGVHPAIEATANVFAGLNVKDDNQQQPIAAAPALDDTFTKSSHGRPMGLSDLELSLRSTASGRPPVSGHPPHAAGAVANSMQSSFGFMSTIQPAFDSSSTSTEPTSPTAFGFMRGDASSTTPTVASSTASQSQRSVLQEPEPSMFSFISN